MLLLGPLRSNMEVGPQSIRPIKHLKAPLGKFTLERFLSWIGVWKQCIKNRFSKMRKGYNVGAFMAQMLTSLSAWKANCAQWYLFSVFFFSAPFPHSLQPPSVRLSTELSCFSRLPTCLFPIVWIFLHLWFFPQLSLHPSLFPSASFSPGARWCSLITGARRRLLAAALHCEGCARIRCVRACVRFGVCLIFFRCFVGREKTTNLALFPALFLSPLLEVDAFLKRFDLAWNEYLSLQT